ncbi:lipopolysaccharide biosynthesis protein [Cellulomonas aerilata]|uniref:Lipopolysaccharide biosynthesis protein n=1 Tax=Cellulomonas aerilata TaxID=515326 RepID=A0A512DF33_9CELL|nr:lipopolysaccharide biosynthesis protein [Cellulomonas aerilata]GEO35061.1 lipopolysaccharide biosynthesis protein [Cellulomonas aerilata]
MTNRPSPAGGSAASPEPDQAPLVPPEPDPSNTDGRTQTDGHRDGDGDGLRERAVSGVLWTAVEKWSVRLSTLVGFIVLGNLLSPLAFGIVALAMTFISFLETVADGGFAGYLVQKKKLTDASVHTAFIVSSSMALLLSVGLVALAPPASELLDVPELRRVLPALAVYLFIAGMSVVPAALMSREMRFKQLAMRQMTATAISIAVAIGLAVGGAGVWALVGQSLTRAVVSFIALWVTSDFRPRWYFDRAEARVMTAYGSKALAVNLQTQVRTQGELFIIGALAGPTTLGFWTVAGRLVGVVVDVFSSVVGAVAHPLFARLQDAPERLARAVGTTRALTALVLVPALVLTSLVSKDVVPAVFGDQWTPTTTVASILALSALLQTVGNFDRSALLATGHPGAELWVTTVFLVIQLTLAVMFHDDLVKLAIGVGISMALAVPVRLLLVRRLLHVPARGFAPTAAVFLAGGLAAAAVVAAEALLGLEGVAYVALAVVVGLVVYAGVVMLVARPVAMELVGIARGVLQRRSRTKAA